MEHPTRHLHSPSGDAAQNRAALFLRNGDAVTVEGPAARERRAERARQRAAAALAEAAAGSEAGAPLVELAFRALGPAPSRRELVLVADAIRWGADREAHALCGVSPEPDAVPVFDRGRCAAVRSVAGRYGTDAFTALDLYTEVVNPGWSPFPAPGDAERADLEELGADL